MISNLEVLRFLMGIPHGRIITYKYLAKTFETHPRAVARVLSKNKELDIYPCFKVVHTDGKIGGYAGWVEEKIRRLEREGVIIKNGKVDPKCFWEGE